MRVIIIEDEEFLATELERDLLDIDPSIEVIKKLTNVKESIQWLQVHNCDLIFSDIELTDGLSFSIFSAIPVNIPVIFVTAYNQYAVKAFETNSIGYVLKPFDQADLKKVLEKYHSLQLNQVQLQMLVQQLSRQTGPSQYSERLILVLGNAQKPTSVSEIAFFMADDRYLLAITNENKKYFYDSTLQKLEKQLNPSNFFRVNRRYLVNKNYITEIRTVTNSRLSLKLKVKTEEEIIVSYQKNNEFKKWIVE
jgi:DNA-binding LytR/AlgR family response regulator